jgi:hypothetical protein
VLQQKLAPAKSGTVVPAFPGGMKAGLLGLVLGDKETGHFPAFSSLGFWYQKAIRACI